MDRPAARGRLAPRLAGGLDRPAAAGVRRPARAARAARRARRPDRPDPRAGRSTRTRSWSPTAPPTGSGTCSPCCRPGRSRSRTPATGPRSRPCAAVAREVRDLPGLAPVTDLTGIVAAYVTPAHQHPLGRVLPAAERVALLDAARAAGAVVVEDDYDSEFRYDVAPVPALASLDRDRVAYLGTAAKAVAPSLRLGWMVPPPAHLDAVNARRVITHEGAPWPVQRAFLALLRDGYVDKVVRTARRVYAERAPAGGGRARRRTPSWRGRSPACTRPGCSPRPDALRAPRGGPAGRLRGQPALATTAARRALTGLVLGFGGVTDDELDRALAAVTSVLLTRRAGLSARVVRRERLGPLALDPAARGSRPSPTAARRSRRARTSAGSRSPARPRRPGPPSPARRPTRRGACPASSRQTTASPTPDGHRGAGVDVGDGDHHRRGQAEGDRLEAEHRRAHAAAR